MPSLVEVAFKGNRKEFFFWNGDEPLPAKAAVIVEADRGEDLGHVYATGELAEKRAAGVAHRPTDEEPVTRVVQRLATPDEAKRARELREQDEIARRKAMERVKANNLVMKLSDAEWRWDRRKLTIYFTADKRVDFRNLVRELASLFRTRIELKQIGVRDEAKRLSGIGRCGREYCSASWLPELRPVNLGVAKDQRLSLNPTQISGACGRLMCCLRYEHEFYVQQRKRFPKEGKVIETSKGEEKVIANDIFRERVTLRAADGEVRIVPLAELRREWKNAPAGAQPLDEDTSPFPYEALSDELLRLQDTSEMPAWRPGMTRGGLLPGGAVPPGGAAPRSLPVIPDEAGEGGRAPSRERGGATRGRERRADGQEEGERGDGGREGANRGRDRRPEGRDGGAARDGRAREGRAGEGRARREGEGAERRRERQGGSRERPRGEGPERGGGGRESRQSAGDAASRAERDAPPEERAESPDAAGERAADGGAAPVGGESEQDRERRLRRRRGRRGGRRSRGGGEQGGEQGGGSTGFDPGPGDGA